LPVSESTSIGDFLKSSLSKTIGKTVKRTKRVREEKTTIGSENKGLSSKYTMELPTGVTMQKCRARYCGKWIREGESFVLHMATHKRAKNLAEKENECNIRAIKGRSDEEIMENMRTDCEKLAPILNTSPTVPSASEPFEGLLAEILSSSASRSSSPAAAAAGCMGEVAAVPVPTETPLQQLQQLLSTTDVAASNEEFDLPPPSTSSSSSSSSSNPSSHLVKRRFDWNLFVQGCVYAKENSGVSQEADNVPSMNNKRKRKCVQ
ncbi:hypothetical protein PFISCL1PPCAC_1470, partial [Pristionchus fissidentatus]